MVVNVKALLSETELLLAGKMSMVTVSLALLLSFCPCILSSCVCLFFFPDHNVPVMLPVFRSETELKATKPCSSSQSNQLIQTEFNNWDIFKHLSPFVLVLCVCVCVCVCVHARAAVGSTSAGTVECSSEFCGPAAQTVGWRSLVVSRYWPLRPWGKPPNTASVSVAVVYWWYS